MFSEISIVVINQVGRLIEIVYRPQILYMNDWI